MGSQGTGPGRGRVLGQLGAVSVTHLTLFLLPPGPGLTPNLRKTRRDRTVYLKEQLQELERHFMTNQYPSYQERLALAARLHLEEHQVQV